MLKLKKNGKNDLGWMSLRLLGSSYFFLAIGKIKFFPFIKLKKVTYSWQNNI